eukprot:scaffold34503_cov129-Isochrysis_galbana.AAC.3
MVSAGRERWEASTRAGRQWSASSFPTEHLHEQLLHHAFFSSLQRSRVKQLYEFGVSIRSFGAGAAETSVSPATTRSRAGVSIGAPRQRVARRTRAAGEPGTPWGNNKRPKLSVRVVSKRPGNGWRSSGGRVYFGSPWFRVAARSAVMGRRGPT